MGSPIQEDDHPAGATQAPMGWSWLCTCISGIGLAVSGGAAFFTFHLLHEPLEAVGASVVDQLASAKCMAIARTLTGLSMARQDVLNGEPEGERSPPDRNVTIGVLTPGSAQLEDYHSSTFSAAQAYSVLNRLPGSAFAGPLDQRLQTQLNTIPRSVRSDLARHSCDQLGYGLTPMAVQAYTAPGLQRGWIVFLHGPWLHGGQPKYSFALVDLQANTLAMSDDRKALDHLIPSEGHSNRLDIRVEVHPAKLLRSAEALQTVIPSWNEPDPQLLGLKIVPFANQVVLTHLRFDHDGLERISRRSAALVFVMGLLATAALVVVSRRSELHLHRLNEVLRHQSRTDGLTGIANRRAWDEALAQEENRRQRFGDHYGLVVVDLDGFKQVNDQQGHQQGDALLKRAAQQLSEELRGTDLLARVGGDEFALLVYNPDEAGLAELVGRIQQRLASAGILASIGAARSEDRATLDQTWAKADHAMYAGKQRIQSPSARSAALWQPLESQQPEAT